MVLRRWLPVAAGAMLCLPGILGWGAATPASGTGTVVEDLNFGRADAALGQLNAALERNANDAQAHNLRCRVYYQEEQWDPAVADCEAAVRLQPNNSSFHLWLGRAYGLKAEHVSIVSGYKLAHKVADEFKQAVQLDPRNTEALADLGEFDATAPGVAGGGVKHAVELLPQLRALDAAAALNLEARIAENHRDYAGAEAALKQAITASRHPAQAWMDLGAFYRKRGRIDDMIAAVHNGAALDAHHGPALVDGATNLSRAGREPEVAIRWLEQYLASSAQTEDQPAFAVHAELAKLLAQQGNVQGAQQQVAAARSLASGYRLAPGTAMAQAGQ